MAIEILTYDETPLGILCLRRRESLANPGTIITEVTLNHEFLMSSYLTESERELTRAGLQQVIKNDSNEPEMLQVLVGGLGLGYTAEEALRSDRVAHVEVIEFLPEVIGWLNDDLIPLSEKLKADARLSVTQGDIYARVAEAPTKQFDLIAIDVDHSPQDVLGNQSHGFYTREGLEKTRSHLMPGGVLGVWSYSDDSPLLSNMKNVFNDVSVKQVTVWNDLINVEQTDWLFFGCN